MRQKLKTLYTNVGPGFIMATVVLGAGSITTSTKIGQLWGMTFFG